MNGFMYCGCKLIVEGARPKDDGKSIGSSRLYIGKVGNLISR